jgi:hypothetical protein
LLAIRIPTAASYVGPREIRSRSHCDNVLLNRLLLHRTIIPISLCRLP